MYGGVSVCACVRVYCVRVRVRAHSRVYTPTVCIIVRVLRVYGTLPRPCARVDHCITVSCGAECAPTEKVPISTFRREPG